MFKRRILCCVLAIWLLVTAVPVMADTANFSTWMDTAAYLRERTQERADEIHFTLSAPDVSTMKWEQLAQECYSMAPLIGYAYFNIVFDDDSADITINPKYRAGVRMLDAWKSGDTGSLSQEELTVLNEAKSIVARLQEQYPPCSIELERAIFDDLCARLTYMKTSETQGNEDLTSATYALTYGKANCQGYSDAFYLLAGIAGFEVGFQYGYTDGGLHVWNTIKLSDQWYIVDVSSADNCGDTVSPEIGVYSFFNAGRNHCTGILSWKPEYETADISDISDNNFFFYAGIPGFGASFDNLDAMAQYCYNERAYDGERDVWIILSGYGEELPVDGINAAMTQVTNQHNGPTQWQFWSWPCGGQQCIMLRWEVF